MQLVDIALRGLGRRIGRMILLVFGLAVGVATVVALVAVTRAMRESVALRLDEYGANILIVPKSGDLTLSYGGITVASASYDVGEMTLADLKAIETIKNARNVSIVAPKLLGAVDLEGRQVLMAGVVFEDEVTLKQWWQVRGEFPATPEEALVGARLAEILSIEPGRVLDVQGEQLRVIGVLEANGSQDDDILFVDLGVSQRLAGKPEGVNLVEVAALCIECPIEEMVEQISGVLPQARVSAMRQAVTLRMETVGQLSRFALGVSVVVIIIGALVVLMTMLGAVSERRQEIGLFRALGFRQRHIEQVILTEAALVSLLGGLVGWVAGMAVAAVFGPSISDVAGQVTWDPQLALAALAGSLVIGLGSSLYPAVRAASLDPSTALRAL